MKEQKIRVMVAVVWVLSVFPVAAWELATDLARDGRYSEAALEFRRLSMDEKAADERGAFSWLAGYSYWKADRYWQAERMLNLTEQAAPELEAEIYLLRANNSRSWRRPEEAAFYLEALTDASHEKPLRRLARLQLAAVKVEAGQLDEARELLDNTAFAQPSAVSAIDAYANGRDKNLVVGGLLGLIPGLGYAYSGEYANALRSLILNTLCIWGVVEFADREQWGGVAVVGFAGVTFYSGSIYGGADAAARYNRRRLRACTDAIEGNARFEPDFGALPLLNLKFSF